MIKPLMLSVTQLKRYRWLISYCSASNYGDWAKKIRVATHKGFIIIATNINIIMKSATARHLPPGASQNLVLHENSKYKL